MGGRGLLCSPSRILPDAREAGHGAGQGWGEGRGKGSAWGPAPNSMTTWPFTASGRLGAELVSGQGLGTPGHSAWCEHSKLGLRYYALVMLREGFGAVMSPAQVLA
jgi:hypothetical protein